MKRTNAGHLCLETSPRLREEEENGAWLGNMLDGGEGCLQGNLRRLNSRRQMGYEGDVESGEGIRVPKQVSGRDPEPSWR